MRRWLAERRKGLVGLATLIVGLAGYVTVPDQWAPWWALLVSVAGVVANYGVPNARPPQAGQMGLHVENPAGGFRAAGPPIYRTRPDVPTTYGDTPPGPDSVGFPKT